MLIYKSRKQLQLFLLRAICFITIFTSLYLFRKGLNDYGILVVIIGIFFSIPSVTTIVMSKDVLKLTKYYLYGFVFRTTTFGKEDQLEMLPFEIDFSDPGSQITNPDWGNVLFSGSYKKSIVSKKFIIKKIYPSGNIKRIKTSLSATEYSLISHLIEKNNKT